MGGNRAKCLDELCLLTLASTVSITNGLTVVAILNIYISLCFSYGPKGRNKPHLTDNILQIY